MAQTVATDLHRQLQQCVQRGRVLTSAAQMAGYDTDGLGYKLYRPDAVIIPADTDELVNLLSAARSWSVPITMRGAGTSLSGGPVAAQGGVVIHTSHLRRVVQVCQRGFWCEVESGVVLNQLDAVLQPYGLFYPPDPSSGPVCTLGGNVAMNAGGAHCFRYGVTSNYVLGVEAVLLDGTVHRFGGPAGGRGDWREDWKRLMVGSEGTLAAFTRFWLRLLPRPEKCWTYRATFGDLKSAERAIHVLSQHSAFPVAIELMDPRCVAMVENSPMAVGLPKDAFLLVTEIDGPAELVDVRAKEVAQLLRDVHAMSVEYSDDDAMRNRLWKARKVAGGLMGQMSPDFLVQDAVIPKRALAEVLQLVYDEADAAGLPAVNVFHAGDGNLHPNFLFDSRRPGEVERVEAISKRLMQRVVDVGGTLSGEHGIGNDKAAYMPLIFGPTTLRMQLAVPRVFNPQHQLNPLKVFTSRKFKATVPGAPASELGKSSPGAALFQPFFDEIDGSLCGPASMNAEELRQRVGPHAFRFPLWLDPRVSLCEQLAASGYASASSRFGPFCDNIMGMNWRLPDGRIVRIGERVVKSTTGYDLLRFFLQSDGRMGQPVDLVVRLRPDFGASGRFLLRGTSSALEEAVRRLIATCWIHWFDAVDVRFDEVDSAGELVLTLNCPDFEWPTYEAYVGAFAAEAGLSWETQRNVEPEWPGLPDVTLKTVSDHCVPIAREMAATGQWKTVAIVYPGVVHGYLCDKDASLEHHRDVIRSTVARYNAALHEVAGDWQSRLLPRPEATGAEAEWLKILEREFAAA